MTKKPTRSDLRKERRASHYLQKLDQEGNPLHAVGIASDYFRAVLASLDPHDQPSEAARVVSTLLSAARALEKRGTRR